MGEQRQRTRTRSKVDDLPEELKVKLESMLLDISNTYTDISVYLKTKGHNISKSAIGRYALRTNNATQRLLEAQEQTRILVEAIKKNPDADYTEGALQIMSGELTKKFAQAQEEWDDMPLDKAARVMVALSRTKIYKDKVRAALAEKAASLMPKSRVLRLPVDHFAPYSGEPFEKVVAAEADFFAEVL